MTTDKNEAERVSDEDVHALCDHIYAPWAKCGRELRRLRALDVEPRALRKEDEYLARKNGCEVLVTRLAMHTPPNDPICRIVRVPIPAAEPEEPKPIIGGFDERILQRLCGIEPEEPKLMNTDPAKCAWNTDGYWCHAGTCKVCNDRYDAGERSGWNAQPEEPKRPEPLKVGDAVRKRPWRGRIERDVSPTKGNRRFGVKRDDGTTTYHDEDELERLPAEPEPEDPDVARLKFCVGLGADHDASVNDLHRSMSLNRKTTQRRMAVEIARRRLAEMDAEKHPAEPEPASAEEPRCVMCGQVADGLHPSAQMGPQPSGPLPISPLRAMLDGFSRRATGPPPVARVRTVLCGADVIIDLTPANVAALRQIVETAPDAETIRRAAIALVGGGA